VLLRGADVISRSVALTIWRARSPNERGMAKRPGGYGKNAIPLKPNEYGYFEEVLTMGYGENAIATLCAERENRPKSRWHPRCLKGQ
jgi:hypothetical protein